jgi:alpha-L-arabinofuranosidase
VGAVALAASAPEATIQVDASRILHSVSPYLTGACLEDVNHEIYGGLYSQMVFGESFQEPAPSPSLAGFTQYGGTWTITNGTLLSRSGSGPRILATAGAQSSGDLSVQVRFAAKDGGDAGLVFQVTQPGLGADAFTGYEVSLSPAGNVVLGRHLQNWTLINQTACSVPLDQWIPLEVKYTNAVLTVLVNGSRLIQYTDTQSPLTSGQVGLRNYQQEVQFQNFQVDGSQIPFAYRGTPWPGAVSGMWNAIQTGTIAGQCSLEANNPFVGTQSQRITVTGGAGKLGVANQSLNRWGMNLVAGKAYDGCLDVRADAPINLTVALESADGAKTYATQDLLVTSNHWQRLDFTLTPSASDTNGRLAITLGQPGSMVLGYVFLEPGNWGRFHGLPVRQDVVAGLTNQGVTVLRYGGSMVNAAGYRWKNMVGPRDHRPPYTGTWYACSTDGWGIPDFLDLCEAARFLGVPDFNINESPQDMADFIDYVNGSTNTFWGARRLADGHPAPYGLTHLELGNEERVDESYFQKFKPLAEAIWAKDTNIVIVVGDFQYSQVITNPFSFGGADSGITSLAAQRKILQLAGQHHCEVWFDLHVWDDGPKPTSTLDAMFSYYDALDKLANGAHHRVVVFELNANNHSQRRALANALAINAIERDGRLPITTSANCLQPDGQNDNGWDQGLLFLNPSQVWLEPPGYVCQMKQAGYQPLAVPCAVVDNTNLDASAKLSADGRTLTVQVVNLNASPTKAGIRLNGFSPAAPAELEQLAGGLDLNNSASNPNRITPSRTPGAVAHANGLTECALAPFSFTVMTFQGQRQSPPPMGR